MVAHFDGKMLPLAALHLWINTSVAFLFQNGYLYDSKKTDGMLESVAKSVFVW